jgi:hypothetical protein
MGRSKEICLLVLRNVANYSLKNNLLNRRSIVREKRVQETEPGFRVGQRQPCFGS